MLNLTESECMYSQITLAVEIWELCGISTGVSNDLYIIASNPFVATLNRNDKCSVRSLVSQGNEWRSESSDNSHMRRTMYAQW